MAFNYRNIVAPTVSTLIVGGIGFVGIQSARDFNEMVQQKNGISLPTPSDNSATVACYSGEREILSAGKVKKFNKKGEGFEILGSSGEVEQVLSPTAACIVQTNAPFMATMPRNSQPESVSCFSGTREIFNASGLHRWNRDERLYTTEKGHVVHITAAATCVSPGAKPSSGM